MKPVVPKERINNEITAKTVRLIDENGEQLGVVSIGEAQAKANRTELDLVEISPNANPPVCKIMDFGTYHYKKERKMRESRKKQHIVQTKEVKFGPNTEEHDYTFKKNNAIKFLSQHNKVKFTVRFRGRQLAHKDLGFKLLEKLVDELKDIIEVESEPRSEGRTIYTVVAPKKDIDKILEKQSKEQNE
ncbi:MAG: translation initiation factor IF-3 [Candidatus Cloacimonetes bacterium]|nr:translation initiation factor IF-3 [Candidatus Cloacimonadota bacterium]MCF7814591.1 translation initiation factor IF-3 [Candidatus Cloacimonadota bacterium]MCF7869071.1 translation initiation factor IF-3 [Candidatus Cloacimonadota bacterium]MCF7884488.1 translation initiation factor IF-3 [Candidatus Cloacimonadota bacterium]